MRAEVIRGHIDIAQPFFSPGGSFWTNSVTALVAGGTRQQLASLAGGNCYATRYESLALIPLKWGDVNIGLIQLNDRRPGRFSPSSITSLEHAAIIVAAGLVSRGATEELRRSEEKYRLIVEASLEGILVADHEFRLIYVNDALAKMLGYSPDELVGKDVQDFFYDPPGPEPDKHLESRRAGQDEIHERRFRHKDGHPVWTIVSAKSLKDEAGSFAGSFAMITDISRIKKLEEELRQSAKQYRTLVETIPDVLTRLDRQLRFTNVSSNMTQYTGIPHHLFIGKTHRETGLPAQMCDFAEDTIKKVFVTERPMETEFTFNGPEGEKIINWRVIPEPDAQGLINSVITLGRDITEHRRTEREYQTLFREMFDGFAVHEIILDDEGKPVDYRFLAVNPAFERLTGLKAEDVVGRRILEILPDTEPHWIEAYGRVALTGKPAFFEMHHNGLGKDFQISAS